MVTNCYRTHLRTFLHGAQNNIFIFRITSPKFTVGIDKYVHVHSAPTHMALWLYVNCDISLIFSNHTKNSYEWWCVSSNTVKEWRYDRELVTQCSFIDLIAEVCSVEWNEQDEEGNHPYEIWGSDSGIFPQGLRQATESSVRTASLQAEFHPRPGVLPIWLCCLVFSNIKHIWFRGERFLR